jgi:hypothetical protein
MRYGIRNKVSGRPIASFLSGQAISELIANFNVIPIISLYDKHEGSWRSRKEVAIEELPVNVIGGKTG